MPSPGDPTSLGMLSGTPGWMELTKEAKAAAPKQGLMSWGRIAGSPPGLQLGTQGSGTLGYHRGWGQLASVGPGTQRQSGPLLGVKAVHKVPLSSLWARPAPPTGRIQPLHCLGGLLLAHPEEGQHHSLHTFLVLGNSPITQDTDIFTSCTERKSEVHPRSPHGIATGASRKGREIPDSLLFPLRAVRGPGTFPPPSWFPLRKQESPCSWRDPGRPGLAKEQGCFCGCAQCHPPGTQAS